MKVLKSETFWILFVLFGLCGLLWYRTSNYYDKVLDGTKYQVHKKDYRPHEKNKFLLFLQEEEAVDTL